MSAISKRDAAELADSIRRAKIAAQEISERYGGGGEAHAFLGGLESLLQHFAYRFADAKAAAAIVAAFNHKPTPAEVEEQRLAMKAIIDRCDARSAGPAKSAGAAA
jgi:oligoribonuclease NrnB/cAMP/cGMP phosphodiesterase (DHH superfamily)